MDCIGTPLPRDWWEYDSNNNILHIYEEPPADFDFTSIVSPWKSITNDNTLLIVHDGITQLPAQMFTYSKIKTAIISDTVKNIGKSCFYKSTVQYVKLPSYLITLI